MNRRLSSLALAAAALAAGFGIAGCAAASPSEPSDDDPGTGTTGVRTVDHGWITLHDLDGARLLAETERPDGGPEALLEGPLALNDQGCFSIGDPETGFTGVVFPHGTSVAGPDTVSFGDAVFAVGDELALVGGGLVTSSTAGSDGAPQLGSPAADALGACGFSEVFVAWDDVELRADFERGIAEGEKPLRRTGMGALR
ncbi:MAG: hypothetical protein QM606_01055 [Leucobacter sp.]